jgi:antibiotic biosynthesis monooxygenase (ABM) superfamily enzyme
VGFTAFTKQIISQGEENMADKPVIVIVGTVCTPENEERFNKWYNEVHIPMLLKYKKLLNVARYKALEEVSGQPKYIAIYKYASAKDMADMNSSPEFAAAIQEMQGSWPKGGMEVLSRPQYELIKEWGK